MSHITESELNRRAGQFLADNLIPMGSDIMRRGQGAAANRRAYGLPTNDAHPVHGRAAEMTHLLASCLIHGTLDYTMLLALAPAPEPEVDR